MKMRARGSCCVFIITSMTTGDTFTAVRQARAGTAVPHVHLPAGDEGGLHASMARLHLSASAANNVRSSASRAGRLWSGHAMVAHDHEERVGSLERRVGIVDRGAGIFRAGRPGSGHAMVDCKHPRLAELENHVVGTVNSGRGEARWSGGDMPFAEVELRPGAQPLTELLPESLLQRVAAFLVDPVTHPRLLQAARVGRKRALLDRLDVLGMFCASTLAADAWASVRDLHQNWQKALEAHQNSHGPGEPPLEYIFEDDVEQGGRRPSSFPLLQSTFRDLCDGTSTMLRTRVGYGRDEPVPAIGSGDRVLGPQLREGLRLRPGARVRIKPWGAFGTRTQSEMREWLGSILSEGRWDPLVRWSVYLEGYANLELSGEVVEFLPPGTIAGLPRDHHDQEGGYLLRFGLPALSWPVRQLREWGWAGLLPFFEVGRDVAGESEHLQEDAAPLAVPEGGWRLTPAGARRLAAGQEELLLEVPYSRLYVDVDEQERAQNNPFETVLAPCART